MLNVEKLNKTYATFCLQDVSFRLEKGFIVGFIGQNGAGKTTTLKSILNLVHADSGTVTILGKDMTQNETEIKQQIGFMLGSTDFYPRTAIKKVAQVYSRFYREWNEDTFDGLLKKFAIDPNKKINELSDGMRVKLGLALALSHNAQLLILDEPTSGLDPVARDELLDLFQEIIEDGQRSILFSTHITSDLDKCADYILFIQNGKIVANDTRDNLIENHIIVKGKLEALTEDLKARLVGFKTNPYGFSALALRENIKKADNLQTEVPNLEDLMVYFNKEANK